MLRIENEAISSKAEQDYLTVKTYLEVLEAPFYDYESEDQNQRRLHSTPVKDITSELLSFVGKDNAGVSQNRFYLKEEYRNGLTGSVKGRAVASMVLNAISAGAIYDQQGTKKKWIEPTSGNTGKGLAEIARLLGVEFTAVLSRMDVSPEIKNSLVKAGAKIITIGSEYSVGDLEELARAHHKSVHYYWSAIHGLNENARSLVLWRIRASRRREDTSTNEETATNDRETDVKQVEPRLLFDVLLPLAVDASKSPIIKRVEAGESDKLKNDLIHAVPELNDPKSIVAFFCNHGSSSMALSNLVSQLGFDNTCSLTGGMDALKKEEEQEASGTGSNSRKKASSEFCPVPGSSIAKSSIEFVKKVVAENPDEYFTFMQYENVENVRAHMLTTGPELKEQVPDMDAVVCTFGTGGTATGLARYFNEKGVEVYVAFPERPVEGIRTLGAANGLSFYRREFYSRVLEVDNEKSNSLFNYLLKRGISVGPSTAVALQAAIDASSKDHEKTYVVIAADGIENYSSRYGK